MLSLFIENHLKLYLKRDLISEPNANFLNVVKVFFEKNLLFLFSGKKKMTLSGDDEEKMQILDASFKNQK